MHGVKVSNSSGVGQWRIEGPVPEPVVTVDAAIKYVTGVHMSTKYPFGQNIQCGATVVAE